jgi:hypothetical protein
MDRERRYSEEAGVVNLRVLETMKEQLQAIDAAAAAQRRTFTEAHATPESCSGEKVATIAACLDLVLGNGYRGWSLAADPGVDCSSSEVATALLLLR